MPEVKTPYQHDVGVFLARMQPLHIAHMFLIQTALEECREVYVVLGSANKHDMLRNPFTLEFRRKMLEEALAEAGYTGLAERLHIFELPDWSLENDSAEPEIWGRYLYYNIVSRTEHKRFASYYSDNSAIIKSWFNSEVRPYVTLRLFNRAATYEGLSATRIRDALANKDIEYITKYCPPVILRNLDYISSYYQVVTDNPSAISQCSNSLKQKQKEISNYETYEQL